MSRPATDAQWTQLRNDVGRLVARRLPGRADVDDVVQEVLFRVWRNGDGLRDDERFGAWLSRIAYTATADHMRARRRHPLARYEYVTGREIGDATATPPENKSRFKELITAVLRPFVLRLPQPYREAVVLSELDGLPHKIVAERLGLSVSGVKSRVQRGRKLLRAMLERCCRIALDARGAPLRCEPRQDRVSPACLCQA